MPASKKKPMPKWRPAPHELIATFDKAFTVPRCRASKVLRSAKSLKGWLERSQNYAKSLPPKSKKPRAARPE